MEPRGNRSVQDSASQSGGLVALRLEARHTERSHGDGSEKPKHHDHSGREHEKRELLTMPRHGS